MKLLFLLLIYAIQAGLGLIVIGSAGCYFGYPILGGITIFIGVLLIILRILLEGLNFQ